MGKCVNFSFVIALTIGVIMTITGTIVLVIVLPSIFNQKLYENLVLREGSESTKLFESPPLPSYLSFHFFHVLNKDDVNTKSAKPEFAEKGPYVYRLERRKNIIKWDSEHEAVTYKEHKEFFFEAEKSNGDLTDVINHINVVSIVVKTILENEDLLPYVLIAYGSMDEAVEAIRGDLIESHSVQELIFDSFSIVDYLPAKFATMLNLIIPFFPSVEEKMKFAFYKNINDSFGEELVVSTGKMCLEDIGNIKLVNGKRQLEYWNADSCNAINGTNGEQFPPGVSKEQNLYAYSSDICRSITLQYEQDVTVEGIPAYRFVLPPGIFADPNKYKENMCFCTDAVNGTCPSKAGLFPLAPCKNGTPVVLSAPYFYMGEEEYYNNFLWSKPTKEHLQTFLDIEPLTGKVISAVKRLQINIKIGYDDRLMFLNNTFLRPGKTTYFPAIWVQESGAINKDLAEKFKNMVLKPYRAGKLSFIALIVAGGVITILVPILIYIKQRGRRNPGNRKS